MTEETKIFVSHHHSDKVLLARVKAWLEHYGIRLFLAHQDIKEGESDIPAIKREIQQCDMFFVFGNENTQGSHACNHEVGMALAYDRQIILSLGKDMSPWGFLPRQQAIAIRSEGDLFAELLRAVASRLPDGDDLNENCKILDTSGFRLFANGDTNDDQGAVVLTPNNNWNDFRYCTEFYISVGTQQAGTVKICHKGQKKGRHTSRDMPPKFPFLAPGFISRIDYSSVFDNKNQRAAISRLLNDVGVTPSLGIPFESDDVFRFSLFRDDFSVWEQSIGSINRRRCH